MGMICNVDMQLGSLEREQFFAKVYCEIWITIRDNIVGHDVDFEYIFHEKLEPLWRLCMGVGKQKNEHVWKGGRPKQ
jgi:hypothetical protein